MSTSTYPIPPQQAAPEFELDVPPFIDFGNWNRPVEIELDLGDQAPAPVQREQPGPALYRKSATVRRGAVHAVGHVARWLRRPTPRPMGWHDAEPVVDGTPYLFNLPSSSSTTTLHAPPHSESRARGRFGRHEPVCSRSQPDRYRSRAASTLWPRLASILEMLVGDAKSPADVEWIRGEGATVASL